jgi:hypothetical protein
VSASRFDAVVDALVTALQGAPGLSGVTVSDGPPVTGDPLPEVVTVGFAFDDQDDVSAEIEQGYHDLGPAAKRDERVEVRCAVYSSNGNADMGAARARCAVLLGEVESALRASPTLGITEALRVEVEVGTLRQSQSDRGAAAIVQFTVTAHSLI